MTTASRHILIVTPVWKDSARLAIFGKELAQALAASPLPIRWVIADDGSGEQETVRLERLREEFSSVFPQVVLHRCSKHCGKGSTVREAWDLAADAEWLAFVDADGSVNAPDFLSLVERAVDSRTSTLAIRKRTATTHVEEGFVRGLAHRGFLCAVHLILGLKCEDPQCGAKVIRAADYQAVAGKLAEDGFAFDSELLAALAHHGAGWQEIPVTWIQKEGAKVRLLHDAWRMFVALLRIRSRRAAW